MSNSPRLLLTVLVALVSLLRSSSSAAKTAKPTVPPTPAAQVEAVLGRYRSSRGVRAKVKKTVTQDLMGSLSVSEGQFYFAKGKLRLEIETPEPSILIYDGTSIWLESRLDPKTLQVSHLKAGALRRTDSLMSALFDKKDALKGFDSAHVAELNGSKVYAFVPKDKRTTEIRTLEIAIRGRELARIKYKDQMENTVDFEFRDLDHANLSPKLFAYKPPKDANVTELK